MFVSRDIHRKKTYPTKIIINIRIIIPVPFQLNPPTKSDRLLPCMLLEGCFNSSCLNFSLCFSGGILFSLIHSPPERVKLVANQNKSITFFLIIQKKRLTCYASFTSHVATYQYKNLVKQKVPN